MPTTFLHLLDENLLVTERVLDNLEIKDVNRLVEAVGLPSRWRPLEDNGGSSSSGRMPAKVAQLTQFREAMLGYCKRMIPVILESGTSFDELWRLELWCECVDRCRLEELDREFATTCEAVLLEKLQTDDDDYDEDYDLMNSKWVLLSYLQAVFGMEVHRDPEMVEKMLEWFPCCGCTDVWYIITREGVRVNVAIYDHD